MDHDVTAPSAAVLRDPGAVEGSAAVRQAVAARDPELARRSAHASRAGGGGLVTGRVAPDGKTFPSTPGYR